MCHRRRISDVYGNHQDYTKEGPKPAPPAPNQGISADTEFNANASPSRAQSRRRWGEQQQWKRGYFSLRPITARVAAILSNPTSDSEQDTAWSAWHIVFAQSCCAGRRSMFSPLLHALGHLRALLPSFVTLPRPEVMAFLMSRVLAQFTPGYPHP